MDDGSTYNIENDGLMQGSIFGGRNHNITQNFYPSDSKSTPPERAWNVPYQRNSYFTGREDLLACLHEQLHAGQDIALSQAISGLGGVGKTQLAVEYAYRYRQEYRYILWARAESEESLISSYVALAHLLNLPQKDAQDQHISVQALKHWLQNNGGWLLILDNADEPKVLSPYIPASPQGHCLYTTRASTLGRLAHCLPVESFPDEQGALFLLRRAQLLAPDAPLEQAPEHERELALQITRALGGLPLALDQAGAYIEEVQTTLSAYWQIYQQRRSELLKRRGLSVDYPESVATTWSLSFEQVEQLNPAAAELLRFCAFLAPDDIPEELLLKIGSRLGPPLASLVSQPVRFNEAIGVLMRYSFVKRDQAHSLLSMHRLVQIILREGPGGEVSLSSRLLRHRVSPVSQDKHWMKRIIQGVYVFLPRPYFPYWTLYERWLPHILVCTDWLKQGKIETLEVAIVLNNAGMYLKERGRYKEAEPLYKRALAITEKKLGAKNPNTAVLLNNIAVLYMRQGKYREAEPLYKQVLAIYEKELGVEHPEIAVSLHNLANLYKDQGRYEEAEASYKRALAIWEKTLGNNDHYTAVGLNDLGGLYKDQGKYVEAESLLQQALAIREKELGAEHPDTACTLNNLGVLYKGQGRYEEAESLLQQALAIREKELGAEHPDTAEILYHLALLYQDQGKYENAEPLYERALTIWERELGTEHPHTRTARASYVALLLAMRQNATSEQALPREKLRGKQKKKVRQRENRKR
ncbi:tetratricopeptide repeat protein [Ktedonobacter robiniae]|uniref:DUF7779 domain-containing protein n=1 Tax=Ktedonobacter robiniae TaxID=2778365 RepID=A0ABQ3UI10_9CHLR|nr:tetratricopeptide repeat protein [Ktedonobacter robiniae]GHO52060.1 hypothetical protein KSB_05350 [Ktedonobacter robiniae]